MCKDPEACCCQNPEERRQQPVSARRNAAGSQCHAAARQPVHRADDRDLRGGEPHVGHGAG